MAERTLKTLSGVNADERVVIVQRRDGAFTYRVVFLLADGKISVGPDCGIYDSAETAESEARSRRVLSEG